MQEIPVSTAYSIWVAIGVIGTVLVGYFIFKETLSPWQLFFFNQLININCWFKNNLKLTIQ